MSARARSYAAAALAFAALVASSSSCEQPSMFAPRFAVLPKVARVFIGNGLQFHTTIVGATQQPAVRWSVVGPGSIDRNGFYRSAMVPSVADVVGDAGRGVTDSVSVASVRAPSLDRPLLLSSCYEDGTIDAFDPRTRALQGALSVRAHANGVVVDSHARRAFVAADDHLIEVDLARMRWQASAAVAGARFSELALLAGGFVAATDNLADPRHPGVRVFRDGGKGRPVLVSSAPAGDTPEGIVAADGGRTLYVTAINSNSVMRYVVDARGALRRTNHARTAARPFGVAVDPVRRLLFVADNDTATLNGDRANPGLERFRLPGLQRVGGVLSMGSKAALPLGVAVDVARARLFVTNEGLANVAVFAIPSMRRIATLGTGLTPWLPTLDAARHRLYVPAARADVVSIYDSGSLGWIGSVHTCSYPTSLAVFDPSASGP